MPHDDIQYHVTEKPELYKIEVLSQLRHPNILQHNGIDIVSRLPTASTHPCSTGIHNLRPQNFNIFIHTQAEDRLNIYLEYAHQGSIDKYNQEHFDSLTESVLRTFTRHIVTGLAYLHVNNSIMGNSKPLIKYHEMTCILD
ncbi:hypothetical protein BT93_F1173 [Corymbia citriodora subsp. variegata]|nr:hypothetical protein BT93_F1173 [Corymbia citriodora subsp. variegata]